MRLLRISVVGLALSILAGCTTAGGPGRSPSIAHANPASIAASPAQWDGREVEIVGLLVWQPENLGLYESYGAYCRGGEKVAIAVDWQNWPGITKADNRRKVLVRGIFRNRSGAAQPSGAIAVSSGAPGPGPLEPGTVVRWLSAPNKPCPKALP